MTSIIIRNALISDLSTIIEIYNAAIPAQQATGDLEPISVESRLTWFKQHSSSSYPIWVAELDKQVVGWLSLQQFYGRAAYAKTAEVSVYINSNYQSQGIGKQLVKYMLLSCSTLNLTALVCFIFAHNLPSLKLFRNFGFETWGYLPEVALMNENLRDLVILGRKI
jgi:phosphinothricin acetyltransferase